MYPPVLGFTKESPQGGVTLSGYHIPEGAALFVSWNSNHSVHKLIFKTMPVSNLGNV